MHIRETAVSLWQSCYAKDCIYRLSNLFVGSVLFVVLSYFSLILCFGEDLAYANRCYCEACRTLRIGQFFTSIII